MGRAAAYDAHMQRVEQQAKEAALAAEAEKWAQRRLEQREREYAVAERLYERALKMLEYPIERTKRDDGKTVLPAGWRQVDIASVIDTATKIARLSMELETERTKHDVGDVDPFEQLVRRLDGLATRLGEGGAAAGPEPGGGGAAAV